MSNVIPFRTPNGPDLWDRILALVDEPQAVVAGGAVRDHATARQAKDIDVFVPKNWLGSIGKRLRAISNSALGYAFDGSDPNLCFVETYEVAGWEVQVIGLDIPEFTPEAVMKRIDLGLCQAVYDGRYLDFTDAFHDDLRNRTLSVVRADNSAQAFASIARAKRLRHRLYADFTIKPHKDFPTV